MSLRSRIVDGVFGALELVAIAADLPRRVRYWWARRGNIAPERCDLNGLRDNAPIPLDRARRKVSPAPRR